LKNEASIRKIHVAKRVNVFISIIMSSIKKTFKEKGIKEQYVVKQYKEPSTSYSSIGANLQAQLEEAGDVVACSGNDVIPIIF
jgi:hypothetical protein